MKNDYDIIPISKNEANNVNLDAGEGNFEIFYQQLLEKETPTILTDDEKKWSFIHKYIIFKKTGTGDAKSIMKWNKILTKKDNVEII